MNEQELVDVGEQVAVKHKRPKRSEQMQPQTEPGDNRKYILHSMRLAELPKCDLKSLEDVTQRIRQYFQICAEEDMKPSLPGLALAMGTDRQYLWEIRVGKKGKNPEIADAIKKACSILELQLVNYMENGKINPVTGIFLAKNNHGYTDKQEVVVTPNNPLGDTKDQKELEERYLESIVDD